MIVVTTQDVLKFAPDLDADPALLDVYLDLARDLVGETAWGTRYTKGVSLLTLHLFTIGSLEGSGSLKAVTSESVGELSVSYSSPETLDAGLSLTKWGQLFKLLRGTIGLTPLVV